MIIVARFSIKKKINVIDYQNNKSYILIVPSDKIGISISIISQFHKTR